MFIIVLDEYFMIYDNLRCDMMWVVCVLWAAERGGVSDREGGRRGGWQLAAGGDRYLVRGGCICYR